VEIPGYRDFEEIGSGSASVVYRAYQEQFARTVAVKVLSVGSVEERLRRRFERECAATGRLTGHPNIVTVLDSGFTAEGSPYITTAYYAHGSLGDRLKTQGPLPLDETLTIGVKVAGALEAVHHAEILHRDIKPSNLLESGYGEPALTGFGISAIDPAQQAMTMAQSFAPVHTPPEVVLGKQATEATDTYQLASTLYALLTGHAPFETGSDDGIFAMLSRIQENEVPPIDRPDVPPQVVEVLRVAMAKKPEDRYPSSAAFGEAIQKLQQELGMSTTALVSAVDGNTTEEQPESVRPLAEQTILLPNMSALQADLHPETAPAAPAAAPPGAAPVPPPGAPPVPPPAAPAPPPSTMPAPAAPPPVPPTMPAPAAPPSAPPVPPPGAPLPPPAGSPPPIPPGSAAAPPPAPPAAPPPQMPPPAPPQAPAPQMPPPQMPPPQMPPPAPAPAPQAPPAPPPQMPPGPPPQMAPPSAPQMAPPPGAASMTPPPIPGQPVGAPEPKVKSNSKLALIIVIILVLIAIAAVVALLVLRK
jgi:serine/threonine-protein kinase PknK